MAAALSPDGPEELLLPCLEMVGLVQEGQQPREDADTVQSIALGGEVGVREGGVGAKDAEARADGEDQRLEVGEVVVAGAADIGRREEREDVFGGFRQLPELAQRSAQFAARGRGEPYTSPVVVIGRNLLGLRQAEDALLEAEFRVGRTHEDRGGGGDACYGLRADMRVWGACQLTSPVSTGRAPLRFSF